MRFGASDSVTSLTQMMIRGAIENASIAVWLMTAPSREERIVRHLRHELTSAKKLKRILAGAGEVVASGTYQRENDLLAIADSCGIERSKVIKEVTATEIVRSASESTGFKSAEMDLVLVFWKLCSAIAHGDRYQTQPAIQGKRLCLSARWRGSACHRRREARSRRPPGQRSSIAHPTGGLSAIDR